MTMLTMNPPCVPMTGWAYCSDWPDAHGVMR